MTGCSHGGSLALAVCVIAHQTPEERFAVQLQALNDMGFTDRTRNLAALQRTSGNVNAAIDILLSEM